MKKVLLATTALVATAGFAAAQDDDITTGVAVTGFAELGVFDEGEDSDLQFHTDIDVTFTMTAETDTGLSFGADIDLDESDTDQTIPGLVVNEPEGPDTGPGLGATDDIEIGGSPAFDNDTQGGESIFISGVFGTLTMGDTDGAFDWALQEAIIGSAINDDHEHLGYSGNSGFDGTYDGQIARYEYAFGDFAVAVSGEIDDLGSGDPILGIGARYSTAFAVAGRELGIGFGLGYQRIDTIDLDDDDDDDGDNANIYGVSADIDFGGGFSGIINYSDADDVTGNGEFEHIGVALGYTVGGLTVAANYGRFDVADVGDEEEDSIDNDADGYGIVVNYDLGGGAEAQFGYGHSDGGDTFDDLGNLDDDGENDTYSLGIAISF